VTHIEIDAVDERDSSWEEAAPRFRVYLHSSGAETTYGTTWTYDITGADVLQVIDWGAASGRGPAHLCRRSRARRRIQGTAQLGQGRGLVWLVGMDGSDTTDDDSRERIVQQGMLRRRTQPIVVPAADAMPTGVAEPFDDGSNQRPPI
jgi:hypothetical protein